MGDLKTTFQSLKERLFPRSGISSNELSLDHVQAVLHNAFKGGAIQESIYGENGYIAHESLARPRDNTGREYSIGKLASAFYRRGHAIPFDNLTHSVGLKHAKKFPATINVSIEAVLSPEFWERREQKIHLVKPDDTIYEILEHDIEIGTDISLLQGKKEEGYRFALDDFSSGISHSNRLHVFGELVDYIKIDGPLVRAFLDGESEEAIDNSIVKFYDRRDFETVLTKLNSFYSQKGFPMPLLIAERVRTAEEAKRMFEIGFGGVQGRDLKPEFFHYTPEAQSLANDNSSCDYSELKLS